MDTEQKANLLGVVALIMGILGQTQQAQLMIEIGNTLPVTVQQVGEVLTVAGAAVAAVTKPIINLGEMIGRLFSR